MRLAPMLLTLTMVIVASALASSTRSPEPFQLTEPARPALSAKSPLPTLSEHTRTVLIGISGRPCAGKTTVARRTQSLLRSRGFRTIIIKQDYRKHHLCGYVHPHSAYRTPRVLCGAFFDAVRQTLAKNAHDFIIVEGSNCFLDASLADYMVKIWLHYPPYPACVRERRRSRFVKPWAERYTHADYYLPHIRQRHPDLHELNSQRHTASWLARRVVRLALAARTAKRSESID